MSTLPARPRRYIKSGLYCRPTKLGDLPVEVAEGRRARRDALLADLGGVESCSNVQLELIDLGSLPPLQLASVDAYLLTLRSLVDKRHRRVWPVVRDRAALSAHVQSLLRDLGLERKARDVKPLDQYLAQETPARGA